MKDTVVKFLKNKGYIIIAFVCLVAVIVAGISVINTGNNSPKEPVISYSTSVSKPISPTNSPDKTDNTKPPQSTSASRPVDDSQNNNPPSSNQQKPGQISIIKPVDGEIQSEFAAKKLVYNSTLQEWRTHSGIDIAGTFGNPVKAAATGKISAVKSDPRYGLTVVMEHDVSGRRFSTVYCGLAKTADGLLAGNKVEAGAVIGTLGDDIFCEKAQGAHLHFELTENNEPLDPSQYWK